MNAPVASATQRFPIPALTNPSLARANAANALVANAPLERRHRQREQQVDPPRECDGGGPERGALRGVAPRDLGGILLFAVAIMAAVLLLANC